jgi:hypothetical protein
MLPKREQAPKCGSNEEEEEEEEAEEEEEYLARSVKYETPRYD